MKLYLAIFCAAIWLQPHDARAAERVALVVGNAAYQKVPRLLNTPNDAAAVAQMFREAKFDVVEARSDLTNTEMRRALREFHAKSRDAEYAVIFYAGHGIEIDGMNYLVPVDAVLEQDNDAFDEAVPLERPLQAARLLNTGRKTLSMTPIPGLGNPCGRSCFFDLIGRLPDMENTFSLQ